MCLSRCFVCIQQINITGGLFVPIAFVLMNTKVGSERDVLRELNKIEGIEEAFVLYGTYNIIARVESESMKHLKQKIAWNIRKLGNVLTTITMIVE